MTTIKGGACGVVYWSHMIGYQKRRDHDFYVILIEGDVSSELVFKLKKHKKETETEPSGPALLVNGVKASA